MDIDLVGKLLLGALVLALTCSANLLTYIGIPYVSDGGAFIFKIHPSSYLLYAALALAVAKAAWGRGSIFVRFKQQTLITIYFGTMCFCLVYAFVLTGRGNLIVLLDTFLPAGIAAAFLTNASLDRGLAVRRVLQIGIFFNGVLASGEAAVHTNLIPLYLDAAAYKPPEQEFRPTALFDHPLTGGMITMIGLALAPSRGWVRPTYTIVLAIASVAFGGRASVAMTLLSASVFRIATFGKNMLCRDSRAAEALLGWTILGCSLVTALLAALVLGLGQRLSGHLYWDASAQVRLSQWGIISELSPSELLFGTRREELIALLTPLWLTDGVEVIENFWLLMFVSLGGLGFLVFLTGLAGLLLYYWQRASLRGRILLIATITAASTSNSLGRKSSLLLIMVVAMTSFVEPAARVKRADARGIMPEPAQA